MLFVIDCCLPLRLQLRWTVRTCGSAELLDPEQYEKNWRIIKHPNLVCFTESSRNASVSFFIQCGSCCERHPPLYGFFTCSTLTRFSQQVIIRIKCETLAEVSGLEKLALSWHSAHPEFIPNNLGEFIMWQMHVETCHYGHRSDILGFIFHTNPDYQFIVRPLLLLLPLKRDKRQIRYGFRVLNYVIEWTSKASHNSVHISGTAVSSLFPNYWQYEVKHVGHPLLSRPHCWELFETLSVRT